MARRSTWSRTIRERTFAVEGPTSAITRGRTSTRRSVTLPGSSLGAAAVCARSGSSWHNATVPTCLSPSTTTVCPIPHIQIPSPTLGAARGQRGGRLGLVARDNCPAGRAVPLKDVASCSRCSTTACGRMSRTSTRRPSWSVRVGLLVELAQPDDPARPLLPYVLDEHRLATGADAGHVLPAHGSRLRVRPLRRHLGRRARQARRGPPGPRREQRRAGIEHSRASNVWANLRKESRGLEVNETFWRAVDSVVLTRDTVAGAYAELADRLPLDDDYFRRSARDASVD